MVCHVIGSNISAIWSLVSKLGDDLARSDGVTVSVQYITKRPRRDSRASEFGPRVSTNNVHTFGPMVMLGNNGTITMAAAAEGGAVEEKALGIIQVTE